MSLVIIGLDGADWNLVHRWQEDLPNLSGLMKSYKARMLRCNVWPPYSPPAWTMMFTGQSPRETGIESFVETHDFEQEYGHLPWLWRDTPEAVVAGLPVPIPFFHKNTHPSPEPRDLRIDLPVTEDEMMDSNYFYRGLVKRALADESPLIIAIWSALDRAGHLFWGQHPRLKQQYEAVDIEIGHLLPELESHAFVILSDHGMQSLDAAKKMGWSLYDNEHSRGDHAPEGIIISNVEIGPLPAGTNAVYNWLQGAKTFARLKALGYA